MVPAWAAMTSTGLRGPKISTSSPTSTPGRSVRSIMDISMQIRPRWGAGPLAVIRLHRPDRHRKNPSA